MKENQEVIYPVGLEIGNSKVCAIAGKVTENNKVSILDYAEAKYNPDFESMSKGITKNKENLISTVNRVLQELSVKTKLEIKVANCNFSNEDIKIKAIKAEYTNDNSGFDVKNYELEELLKSAQKQVKSMGSVELLHCMPTDFFIDEEKVGKYPKGAIGNKLSCNFNAIVNPSERVEEFHKFTEGFSYEPFEKKTANNNVIIDQLIYNGHADALAVLTLEDKEAGVLLINLGSQLTEITVFKDFGLRYTKVLGIGSDSIVKDLSQAFNITFAQAERLMLAGSEISSKSIEINEVMEIEGRNGLPTKHFLKKTVALVVESRLKEIAGLVASDIIESGYARVFGNGIMMVGAATRMGLTKKVFQQTFNPLPIRIGNSTANIDLNTHLELAHPRYSTAIGTMLSFIKPADERMPKTRITKTRRRMGIGFLGKNSLVNKIWEMFDEPELRKAYGE
ncbi:MAG: hypothetical protein NXI00_00140 [Cytophagales bacterium]|nr:hypothetical protein [Cytophagales bacterium]